jgi:hypothetical protein
MQQIRIREGTRSLWSIIRKLMLKEMDVQLITPMGSWDHVKERKILSSGI